MTRAGAFQVTGQLVDIVARRIYGAEVTVDEGRIASIEPVEAIEPSSIGCRPTTAPYLLPGFIDAHVHIESSMLVPTEFARAAVGHGTVATVSDPHEIGNVLGVAGVRYMLNNARQSPFKFYFGAPSCVPATPYETTGATISVDEVKQLLADPQILYLSEMMNFPGVLSGDSDCLAKIEAAQQMGKPVDGHAPGLRGDEAARYIAAGITTDHECFTKDEALDKLAAGCKISIREGSAARNFDALVSLLGEYPKQTMLCSDDMHPDELLEGHIGALVRRAVSAGIDVFDVLQAACLNPISHYQLGVGQLRVGDPADFIEVDSLTDFVVSRTWIDGELVAENGLTTIPRVEPEVVNKFVANPIKTAQLEVAVPKGRRSTSVRAGEGKLAAKDAGTTYGTLQVIEALDGQLMTNRIVSEPAVDDGQVVSDVRNDVLKIVVVNRYCSALPAIAFIKNFGLKQGAMASSVAHDSHNVIAVGANDEDLAAAINGVMDVGGGLSAVCMQESASLILPLPVAGLMATGTCAEVGADYKKIDAAVKRWGSTLRAPYMTLSFMGLLVIPQLKLSDLGLFDGQSFQFAPLWVEPSP